MTQPITIAKAYYAAIAAKDAASLGLFLHPNAHLIGPRGATTGKESILKDAQGFMNAFTKLHIRTAFGDQTQALLVLDVTFPGPIGLLRATSLLTVEDELITRIELFFDASQLSA